MSWARPTSRAPGAIPGQTSRPSRSARPSPASATASRTASAARRRELRPYTLPSSVIPSPAIAVPVRPAAFALLAGLVWLAVIVSAWLAVPVRPAAFAFLAGVVWLAVIVLAWLAVSVRPAVFAFLAGLVWLAVIVSAWLAVPGGSAASTHPPLRVGVSDRPAPFVTEFLALNL